MLFKELLEVLDTSQTLWINQDGQSELYHYPDKIPNDFTKYYNANVLYITQDSNNELTIELD